MFILLCFSARVSTACDISATNNQVVLGNDSSKQLTPSWLVNVTV